MGVMWAVVVAVLAVVGGALYTRLRKRWQREAGWVGAVRDVVVLHKPPPGRFAPALSPFVLKLETFLRWANIQYTTDYHSPMGPKGLTPWITLNGEHLTDSQLIMDRLCDHFGVAGLEGERGGVARMMAAMLDDRTIWGLRVWRYTVDKGRGFEECVAGLPYIYKILVPLFCRKMRSALKKQGMGRHSFTEAQDIVRKDLQALDAFLGDKAFMFGCTLSAADCVVFGHLANILYNYQRSPFYAMLTRDLPRLTAYVVRLREGLWPDWNSCLNPPRATLMRQNKSTTSENKI